MSERVGLERMARELRMLIEDGMARGELEVQAAAPPTEPAVSEWSSAATGARAARPGGAGALAAVRAELGDCQRCGLCRTRKNIVFGVGSPDADLVVVGEGPGAQEDLRGEPFVGPAGQMLDKMLENVIGLKRDEVYIVNVVKCRPPRNRNPEPEEIAACRPFLDGQLSALQPKVLLVLGTVAYKALMQTSQGITRNRGRWHVWREPGGEATVPVMPTFHPAYLLRKPQDKRLTFADLKALKVRYDEVGGRRR